MYHSTKQSAAYTGTSTSYLEKLRCTGGGPVFYKLGRAVRYKREDLDAWMASKRRRSTSDAGVEARAR